MRPTFTISQDTVKLSATRPIRAAEIAVTEPVRPHDHGYCEITFIRSGAGVHRTTEGSRPLQRGDVIVMVPGEVHAFEPGSGLRVINLYFLSEWLLRDAREIREDPQLFSLLFSRLLFRAPGEAAIPHFRLPEQTAARVERELRDLLDESSGVPPAYLRAAFLKLMILAASAWPDSPSEIRSGFRPEVWRAVMRIESAVNHRLPFDPAEITRGSNLSTEHLARLFKLQTGWTPSDYYQIRRIQSACGALLDSDASITEIAMDHGYADASHLIRCFRRSLGITPRAYRKKYERA